MKSKTFEISIPTRDGFLGNECNNRTCKKYFKVSVSNINEKMYCPYCGVLAPKMDLRTKAQEKYIHDAAMEKAKEIAYKEIDKSFAKMARSFRSNKFISFENKPINYKAKRIIPRYKESKVDTQLTCPECQSTFQVFGIFGFCPSCRSENLIIYDTNISIIERGYEGATNKERALRHIYSDLVSAFENFCKKKQDKSVEINLNFQELFEARKYFKKQDGKDIFDNLNESELLTIRRVFQKRHLYTHSDGTINEKYIKKIPEDKKLLGEKAILNFEEFKIATSILRKVVDNIIN